MTTPVSLTRQGKVGLIAINNPPVNALSQAVRQGIIECVLQAQQDDEIKAIVLYCEGRTFVAGADISEFGKAPMEPHLPDVLHQVESCTKPLVAALHGTALGGGLELALCSHYRIALAGSKVGLPEVNLGLIPGSGGTQRLPRIAGVEKALEMITSGRPVAVESVVEQKLIDQVVEKDLVTAAVDFAETLIADQAEPRRVSEIQLSKSEGHDQLFADWRAKLKKKAAGQQAPQYAIDAIENAILLPFDEGLQKEREMFLACRSSEQSRAMRHVFFAEREVVRVPGLARDIKGHDIASVAIIGAGTMGGGIAMCFANAGIPVTLVEMSQENLDRGLAMIKDRYQQNVSKGRMSEQQLQDCVALIGGTCDYADLSEVDLVVEAAFESMEVKREIFSRLDQACKPEAILASNTSYLDINQIAASTGRPDKVLGMHFFSPANIMKLLEVVRTREISDESLATVMKLGKRIGKISVAVGVCYGFVGNRMYACYGREAQALLLEGATPEQIDKAMQSWGMAMGPLSVVDMSGLDIGYKARRENPNRSDDPLFFRPADMLVEANRLGQKTGAGFYRYDSETRRRETDEEVVRMIRDEADRLGVTQRTISDEEIQQRLIFAMINEGARILEEGIAGRSGDIDVIWINGYGFPRYRGGPMQYADETGLDKVLQGIKAFQDRLGDCYWKPANLLEELVAQDKKFSDWVGKD